MVRRTNRRAEHEGQFTEDLPGAEFPVQKLLIARCQLLPSCPRYSTNATHTDKAQVLYFYLIEDDPLVKYTVHEYPSPEAANSEELTENAWLTAKPKSTGLKNGKGSERHIILREDVCDAVDEYLKYNWTPTTEDSGRRPLLVTERGSGRIAKLTIRKYIYELTRPCKTIDKCPTGINSADCPAVGDGKTFTSCKENASPKALRTGLISHLRDQGVDIEDVSGEVDATPQVLKEHYDKPDEDKRRRARNEELRGIDWYGFD